MRGKTGTSNRKELDINAHRLTRGDDEIRLSPQEFRLLVYLVENPGRALTRDSILNGVWGYSCFVGPRNIDRFITALRNKVETDPKQPRLIHTIRGFGYKFEPPRLRNRIETERVLQSYREACREAYGPW